MLKTYDLQGQFKDVVKKFSSRKTEISQQVNETVMQMIEDIEKNGDQAIMKYCYELDGYRMEGPQDFIVSKQEILDGVTSVGKDFMRILERTKEQLIDFHQHQVDRSWSIYKENGVMMGQIVRGLEKSCFIRTRWNCHISFNGHDECHSCQTGWCQRIDNHHTCEG